MKAKSKELLSLLEKSSRCGDEFEYAAMLKDILDGTGLFGETYVDRLANVIGFIGDRSKHTVMLEAHFDEISAVVADINDKGFIRIATVGGVDRRSLLTTEVTVNGLNGVVCSVPPHLMAAGDSEKVPTFDGIYIDLGLPVEEVRKKVRTGDRVEFISHNCELLCGRVSGKALDNKACVYIILTAIAKLEKLIKSGELDVCIAVLFASQEEIGSRGAMTGTYGIDPDEAIVLDVSFAKQNGVSKAPDLGSGVIIERSAFFDKNITRAFMDIAAKKEIKHTVEVSAAAYGTDGDTVPFVRDGIPTALLSLPLRYMHTPVEVVDMEDIESAADLICEYLKGRCR